MQHLPGRSKCQVGDNEIQDSLLLGKKQATFSQDSTEGLKKPYLGKRCMAGTEEVKFGDFTSPEIDNEQRLGPSEQQIDWTQSPEAASPPSDRNILEKKIIQGHHTQELTFQSLTDTPIASPDWKFGFCISQISQSDSEPAQTPSKPVQTVHQMAKSPHDFSYDMRESDKTIKNSKRFKNAAKDLSKEFIFGTLAEVPVIRFLEENYLNAKVGIEMVQVSSKPAANQQKDGDEPQCVYDLYVPTSMLKCPVLRAATLKQTHVIFEIKTLAAEFLFSVHIDASLNEEEKEKKFQQLLKKYGIISYDGSLAYAHSWVLQLVYYASNLLFNHDDEILVLLVIAAPLGICVIKLTVDKRLADWARTIFNGVKSGITGIRGQSSKLRRQLCLDQTKKDLATSRANSLAALGQEELFHGDDLMAQLALKSKHQKEARNSLHVIGYKLN